MMFVMQKKENQTSALKRVFNITVIFSVPDKRTFHYYNIATVKIR